MKNNKKIYGLFILISILPVALMSQHETVVPASFKEKSLQTLDPVVLSNPLESVEDISKEQSLPLPAGQTIPIGQTVSKMGNWEATDGGGLIYRIAFRVENAVGLNAYFRNLALKQGDQLFVYGEKNGPVSNAIDATKNGKQYAVGFLRTHTLVIEFNTKNEYEELPFEIAEIGVANFMSEDSERDYGDAGRCEVLVNCREGDNWQYEKDGIARVLVKEGTKLFWCTGSLVNNTRNDGTPYFLTANHCGKDATAYDYGGWVFYFNYEVEGCEQPFIEPDFDNILTGAQKLAHSWLDVDQASDFKLLLLNEEIPDDFRVFYNGWDRSGEVSPSGVTIHHPQGDVKMISTYDQPIVSVDYYDPEQNENGRYWKVNWIETDNGHGVTEGGSSGCPLFSSEGYLIGSLTGGNASCMRPGQPDYFGKFSYAWESEGNDSTRQLKYWLDPDNTGVLSLKGTNLDTSTVIANFSSDVTDIKVGESVQFYNHSIGAATGYEWHFEGGEPAYSESENPPPVQYNGYGAYKVKLVARSTTLADSIVRDDFIKVLPTLSPNPSITGIYKLLFGKETPESLLVEVFDMLGKEVSPVFIEKKSDGIYIDISTHARGLYLIYIKADEREQIVKASYLNKH